MISRYYIVGCVAYALLMNILLLLNILRRRCLMPGLDWFLMFLGFLCLICFNATCIHLAWIEVNVGGWTKTAVTLLALKATFFNIGFSRHLKHTYEFLNEPISPRWR